MNMRTPGPHNTLPKQGKIAIGQNELGVEPLVLVVQSDVGQKMPYKTLPKHLIRHREDCLTSGSHWTILMQLILPPACLMQPCGLNDWHLSTGPPD